MLAVVMRVGRMSRCSKPNEGEKNQSRQYKTKFGKEAAEQ